MHALIGAAAADDTKITCIHRRWTKDDGGAFDVQLADDNGDSAVMWQVEEWIHDANGQTKQKVDPSGVIMHRTPVAHANPTPVKLKKVIVRTDGAGLKITNWFRTNRPGLPWFSATPAEATASTVSMEEPGSTAVVPGGRHGTLGAFVAHTELAKKETTKTMEAHGGQITKLDEALAKSQEMLQTLMGAIGASNEKTQVLSGRVGQIDEKADRFMRRLRRLACRSHLTRPRLRLRQQLRLRLRAARPSQPKTRGLRRRAAVGVAAAAPRGRRVAAWVEL